MASAVSALHNRLEHAGHVHNREPTVTQPEREFRLESDLERKAGVHVSNERTPAAAEFGDSVGELVVEVGRAGARNSQPARSNMQTSVRAAVPTQGSKAAGRHIFPELPLQTVPLDLGGSGTLLTGAAMLLQAAVTASER